ncbi:MAG: acetate--CoA ligase family protein, partial [Gammaproteobacteria bacterium]|nr:acetate--CoA ligase family protein [Gammaproteobacteria bacterium]
MKINFDKINDVFRSAEKQGRNYLFEHEVYQILKIAGIKTPRCLFVKKGQRVLPKELESFKGDRLVVKVVAPVIVHKTDVGGIQFVRDNLREINSTCTKMLNTIPGKYQEWIKDFPETETKKTLSLQDIKNEIKGFLICEAVDYDKSGFGTELLMGIRNSREFGPIVTMGVGGVEIESLSERLREGKAVSIASPHILQKKDISRVLEPLAVYDKLVGKVRGKEALMTKEELTDTYYRFLQLAAYYSPHKTKHPYVIEDAEVNPFVVQRKKLIALDGLCRFSVHHKELKKRRFQEIGHLLKPKSIAIIGVSEKMNVGHIILNNILKEGFNNWDVYV